jgi:hypothetical protein
MSNPNSFPGIGQTVVHWLGKLFTTERDPAKEKFLSEMASSSPPRPEEFETLLTLLREGTVEIQCLADFCTNKVYYAMVSGDRQTIGAVYKPVKDETLLGDFPTGTLASRDVAAFLVSEALGWHLVPPTVYRTEAPLGPGALQVYIHKPSNYYLLDFSEQDRPALKRVALFDLLTNNGDRKRAHLLPGDSGKLWSIDHGLCFNQPFLVRTFVEEILELDGQPIPEDLLDDVASFRQRLDSDQPLIAALNALLAPPEMAALHSRADRLLTSRRYILTAR